jgi:3-hydroxybutyryl-CoA dehydrogenase
MRFEKVGVLGAGGIGRSLAQALAQTHHQVILVDTSANALEHALNSIANGLRLASFADRELRKADHGAILSRIRATTSCQDLQECRFIVENTTEDWSVKEKVYRTIGDICHPDCVFAVNTSAISIAKIAKICLNHRHIIGMHFMNPVPQKKYVEVVVGEVTTDFAVEAANDLLKQLGKHSIVVRDNPGFVSNRVMMLMINEAIATLNDGTASAVDIDRVFVHCFAHTMGPLATADLIGLDTILRTLEVLQDSYGDPKFEPTPLLRRMVNDGLLGRKTGAGFFAYNMESTFAHGQ